MERQQKPRLIPDPPITFKGSLFALGTVVTWALLSVVNRYCVLKFHTNVMIFTSFLIFSAGVALLIIRRQVTPQNWKSGVKYSWLYTTMQMVKSFFMISTYLYISSSETSILVNIEVVISYLLAYLFFRRKPHQGDYVGIFIILIGFILFIYSLPDSTRTPVAVLVLIAATASCIRSIVVEETTVKSPETTVRQKCGISGYTMFVGGSLLLLFFFLTASMKFLFGEKLPSVLHFLKFLPNMAEFLDPPTIVSACVAGFFLNAASVYFFYATLKWTKSETFMAFRVFQPALTYGFEIFAALSYAAMRPHLEITDFFFGGIVLFGSFLLLVLPSKNTKEIRSKSFITE